jgi:hypothetical protein
MGWDAETTECAISKLRKARQLPKAGHGELVKHSICANQGQALKQGLRGQHAVKWIFVRVSERTCETRMFQRNGDHFDFQGSKNPSRIVHEERGLRGTCLGRIDIYTLQPVSLLLQ